ncbi:hypothetical protein KCV07_g405, partial [Aureobasidium melanogenum]
MLHGIELSQGRPSVKPYTSIRPVTHKIYDTTMTQTMTTFTSDHHHLRTHRQTNSRTVDTPGMRARESREVMLLRAFVQFRHATSAFHHIGFDHPGWYRLSTSCYEKILYPFFDQGFKILNLSSISQGSLTLIRSVVDEISLKDNGYDTQQKMSAASVDRTQCLQNTPDTGRREVDFSLALSQMS